MRRVRVGDVLRLDRRTVTIDPMAEYLPIGIRSFGKGLFRYPCTPGSELSKLRFFEVRPETLIVSNIKAWEGAIGVSSNADRGSIASSRFLSYVPTDAQIDIRYAAYFFLSERGLSLIGRASPGSADRNRTLAIDRFENLEIPLPDLDEQRRIASRLEALAGRTRAVGDATARAERVTRALPSALASGVIRRFPSRQARLGDLASVTRGKGPQYDPESEHAVVNQACVRWEGLDLGRVKYARPEWVDSLSAPHRVWMNDVLVNSTGEGTIGRACVAHEQAVGLPFDSHVLAVRPNRDDLDPDFLTLFLRSPEGQDAINLAKGATTTKQTELGKAKLEGISVPVPPIDVQREVVGWSKALLGRAHEVEYRRVAGGRAASALWAAALNRSFSASF